MPKKSVTDLSKGLKIEGKSEGPGGTKEGSMTEIRAGEEMICTRKEKIQIDLTRKRKMKGKTSFRGGGRGDLRGVRKKGEGLLVQLSFSSGVLGLPKKDIGKGHNRFCLKEGGGGAMRGRNGRKRMAALRGNEKK